MTFDDAIDAFEANPTEETAHNLSETADEYYDDGMIGPDTYAWVQSELAVHGY